MSERIAVLVVVMLLELLCGLGLHNESQAARARIEVERRRSQACVERLQEVRQVYALLSSPEALYARMRAQAGEDPELELEDPEL